MSKAHICRRLADNVNKEKEREHHLYILFHNICNLCERDAKKGLYRFYIPNRFKLKLDIEEYEKLIEMLRKEKFEIIYDREEEIYYAGWKNV